jgi:predicted nucleic acid-binding protein
LIDSDVAIDHMVGRAYAVAALDVAVPQGAGISLITFGEVWEGILTSQRRAQAEWAWDHFLKGVSIVPLDVQTMQTFAEIRKSLRDRGNAIKDFDILIAATTIRHNLTLITRNLKHFDRIDGLTLFSFVQAGG